MLGATAMFVHDLKKHVNLRIPAASRNISKFNTGVESKEIQLPVYLQNNNLTCVASSGKKLMFSKLPVLLLEVMYNNLINRALQCFGKENMQSVLLLGILDLLKMTLI